MLSLNKSEKYIKKNTVENGSQIKQYKNIIKKVEECARIFYDNNVMKL